jgi:hypothetical protein
MKLVADLISTSWFTGFERNSIDDEDKKTIDDIIIDLDQKVYSGYFERSAKGIELLMNDYEVLRVCIQQCK